MHTVCFMLIYKKSHDSGVTTGGNGGSRLRTPLERGRRVTPRADVNVFVVKK